VTVSAAITHYAEAYLAAMADAGALEHARRDMALLTETVARSGGALDRLAAPAITPQNRACAMQAAFGARVHAITLRLLVLCARRSRLGVLRGLPGAFVAALDKRDGTIRATVLTAQPVDESLRTQFAHLLECRTGRPVVAEFATDSGLVAGFRIQYGDTLIDSSVAGALARLQERLTAGTGSGAATRPARGVRA
jgi:ATP synthase F1 delta subunit